MPDEHQKEICNRGRKSAIPRYLGVIKNYRDAVWNLELAVQQVRNTFELEYDTTIEEFLESVYAAGASLDGTDIENYAKSIARSKKC